MCLTTFLAMEQIFPSIVKEIHPILQLLQALAEEISGEKVIT